MLKKTYSELISLSRFYVQFLTPDAANQCSSMLAYQFAQNGYNKAFGIDYEVFKQFADVVIPIGMKRGLSIVAREKITGKMAGAMISYDMYDQRQMDMIKFHPNSLKIANLINKVQGQYIQTHKCRDVPGKYARLSQLAVKDEFKGQNLTKILALQSLRIIKVKGYEQASALYTHPATIKVFEKQLKLTEKIKSLAFEDFQYNGQKPLKHLFGQQISFSVRKLDSIDI